MCVTQTYPAHAASGDPRCHDRFSAYDVVALTYPGSAQANVYGASDAGEVGVVIHRGGNDFSPSGLGSSSFWQTGGCTVNDNSHFVTQNLTLGSVGLGYTYKTIVSGVPSSATTLVSCSSPSPVVHPTARRLTTPYYGHTLGSRGVSRGSSSICAATLGRRALALDRACSKELAVARGEPLGL